MIPSPYAVLATAVFSVSFASLFVRWSAAPPVTIAAYRMGFATLLLVLVMGWRQPGCLRDLQRRELALCVLSGAFLAMHFGTWVTSLRYTTVASSTVLVSLQPFFVMAGSALFYRERVPRAALAAVVLAVGGSALIGGGDFAAGGRALWGDVLALVGAVSVSGYMLIGRRLRRHLPLLAYVVPVYGSCGAFLFLAARGLGQALVPFPGREWGLFLALAIVPTLGGHTMYNHALRFLPAPVVSVCSLGEPVGASLLALLFLGEVPRISTVAGGALVLAGIAWFLVLSGRPSGLPAGRVSGHGHQQLHWLKDEQLREEGGEATWERRKPGGTCSG